MIIQEHEATAVAKIIAICSLLITFPPLHHLHDEKKIEESNNIAISGLIQNDQVAQFFKFEYSDAWTLKFFL